MTDISEPLRIDFPQCLAADFPEDLPGAVAAYEAIAGTLAGIDCSPLARRSPALSGFDWHTYLRCSVARMVHASAALRRRRVGKGRLLDYGSYFGNFALTFARAGFAVEAIDSYRGYTPVFDASLRLMRDAGVRVHDFDDVGYDLVSLEDGCYDVVLCMGVIEHMPGSPRPLLQTLDRVLRPGGVLIIDTPNLVHLYNRQKFARGETVLAEIRALYETELPFEGHYREYTIPEIVWLLRRVGHRQISVEAFNYSSYALGTLSARDLLNHWNMVRDPTMREYLMTVSAKPVPGDAAPVASEDGQHVIEDPEQSWLEALPAAMNDQPSFDVDRELQIVRMQHEINIRDRERVAVDGEVSRRDDLLRDAHDRFVREVQRRDEIIDALTREREWLLSGWRRYIVRRLQRKAPPATP